MGKCPGGTSGRGNIPHPVDWGADCQCIIPASPMTNERADACSWILYGIAVSHISFHPPTPDVCCTDRWNWSNAWRSWIYTRAVRAGLTIRLPHSNVRRDPFLIRVARIFSGCALFFSGSALFSSPQKVDLFSRRYVTVKPTHNERSNVKTAW